MRTLTTKGRQTRARLLEAAEAVFAERSFDEASIVQITGRAGVAMGTFYLYFPSKQAVFSELVRELGHRLRAEISQATAGLASRAEVERTGFKAFFEFTRRHPGLYRIIRQAEFFDRNAFREYYDRLASEYSVGLRTAMTNGEFRNLDPYVLAHCLMGIGDMVGMRWVLWGTDGEVPDRVLDELVEFLLHGAAVPDAGAVKARSGRSKPRASRKKRP